MDTGHWGKKLGLQGDIHEIKVAWSKSSWLFRGWLCLSGYLGISSIASLADTVIKWKGFVLDAIIFYRSLVGHPITNLLQPLNMHLSIVGTDVIITEILLWTCFTRAAALALSRTKIPKARIYFLGLVGGIGTVGFLLYAENGKTLNPEFYFSYLFSTLLTPLFFLRRPKEKSPEMSIFRLLTLQYYAQIVACILFVGALAAINKGLYG